MRPLLPLVLFVAAALIGCASTPETIPEPAAGSPDPAQVRSHPERYNGEQVRWGGTIAGVENREDTTLIEVVARELDSRGRPRASDRSPGRFLAVVDGFLDPAIYAADRSLTVTGTVAGTTVRPVGEHDYTYIRVEVTGHHLWPRELSADYADRRYRYPPPYYYDPWYDPWHPYHRGWPYYY